MKNIKLKFILILSSYTAISKVIFHTTPEHVIIKEIID